MGRKGQQPTMVRPVVDNIRGPEDAVTVVQVVHRHHLIRGLDQEVDEGTGNQGSSGKGPEKKSTGRSDKATHDGQGRKSENGAGDGCGPPKKSVKREPANEPSSNKDDQSQPASQAATETRHNYTNFVSNRLGKYDGTTRLETFLAHFDRCVKYMDWTEKDRLFNLTVSLEGNAGQILWDTGDQATVEGTIQLLRNRFGNANQAERFRAELRVRCRKPGEGLQQLYQDVCRLISLAYPGATNEVTNIVARDSFLVALDDNAFRVRILQKEPPDLNTALKTAVKLEAFDGGRTTADPNRSSADRPQRQKEHFSRVVTEQDYQLSSQGSQQGEINEDKLIRCFREGMKGYWCEFMAQQAQMEGRRKKADEGDSNRQKGGGKWDKGPTFTPLYGDQATATGNHGNRPASERPTPDQRRFQGKSPGNKSASFRPPPNRNWKEGGCHNCGKQGHWQRECPYEKRENTSNQPGNGNQQPQQQHEPRVQLIDDKTRKKTTYLMVCWRGKQYNALLDTGCEVSVVGRRLLPKNIELSPPETDLFTANCTKIPLLGRMNMDFTVEGERYSARLAVTNTVEELILGIDWLTQTAAKWDFGEGKILLGGRWIRLQQRVTEDRVRRVYSAESTSIPPLSEADIPVTVTWPTLHLTHSDWLVELKAVNESLVVARTLVSGYAPNTTIRVINISDKEYKVNCDAELGTACQASVTLETDMLAGADAHAISSQVRAQWTSIRATSFVEQWSALESEMVDSQLNAVSDATPGAVMKTFDWSLSRTC